MSDEIRAKIIKIIQDQLSLTGTTIKDTDSFVDDLGADSLDTVELILALEEAFDISIPDEEAEKIKTVHEAVVKIETALKEKK